ncbi:MAG TPA: helix-turn-helix domain-containing protein [Spirochaetota bacterium]|nr:helix-turn-helix domain-containing protein [Spirochaetota bacterium]
MIEIKNPIWISLLVFGPFLCLLMTTAQILKKDRMLSIYYSLAHLTMGLWLFQSLVYSSTLFKYPQYISSILLPVSFLAPVFQRYRYTWVVCSDGSAKNKFFRIMYVPSVFTAVYLVLIFVLYDHESLKANLVFNPLLSESFIRLPLSFKILHLLYPLSKLISIISLCSLLVILVNLWKSKGENAPRISIKLSFFIITLIIFATSLVFAGDFVSFRLCLAGGTIATLTICIMVIVSYKYPSLRKYLIYEIDKTRYSRSKIKSLDVDTIITRILEIMQIEKAFSDEDFSLKILARDLDINTQQLSEILNERMGKSFNTFINEYRINEAKILLVDEPGRSINSIANAVGFSSNAAFSITFSKYEGCSPSRFRKLNL